MAIKKYLSLDGLSEYDALVKEEISNAVSTKANSSHTHTVSNITNLQTALDSINEEIDGSIKTLSVSGKTITYTKNDGSTGTITTQDTNTDTKVTNTLDTTTKAYVTGTTSATTSTGTQIFDTGVYLDTTAGQLVATTFKGALDGNAKTATSATSAVSATKATQDGSGNTITSTYETKSAASAKLTEAKTYADAAAAKVKNDLLNGAGGAYDTLKELGDLIDVNVDAIDALEVVAANKADKNHTHTIADVSSLQSALDGKAATSHGTHVSYSTTVPVMDGSASVGSASTVARSDHKHPSDTSRASKTEFDTHVSDTVKHITSTERTNWNAAYTHSTATHAPSNAEKNQNAFSNVVVGNTTITADTTTDSLTIAAGTGISVAGDTTNDKVTITNSGVISVATGSSNGTISVNTNGTSANVAVKGLGSAAYTNSSAYATAGHTHTVDSALSSSSTNPVQNKVVNSAISSLTSTVSTNTSSINSHTSAISNLQTAVAEIQDITSEEIQALFA